MSEEFSPSDQWGRSKEIKRLRENMRDREHQDVSKGFAHVKRMSEGYLTRCGG